jgi:hypothetical protein
MEKNLRVEKPLNCLLSTLTESTITKTGKITMKVPIQAGHVPRLTWQMFG